MTESTLYNMTPIWNEIEKIDSNNPNVLKFIFKKENAIAESVLYQYPTYSDRTVICCSTQSGCPMGCRFCGAGDYFVRSLTDKEIIEQPITLLRHTGVAPYKIKNLQIMFMSMGEPMLNYDNLELACRKLHDLYPTAKLLISTSAPRNFSAFSDLAKLSKEIPTIGLQFSVHESTDERRQKLIPAKTMTLKEIAQTGESWFNATGRQPFFNYCVGEENNTVEDADRLQVIFNPKIWQATLSVICERDEYLAGTNDKQRNLVDNFSLLLQERGYCTRVFDPAGQDAANGCGQLWETQKWFSENADKVKKTKGYGLPIIHMPT